MGFNSMAMRVAVKPPPMETAGTDVENTRRTQPQPRRLRNKRGVAIKSNDKRRTNEQEERSRVAICSAIG